MNRELNSVLNNANVFYRLGDYKSVQKWFYETANPTCEYTA